MPVEPGWKEICKTMRVSVLSTIISRHTVHSSRLSPSLSITCPTVTSVAVSQVSTNYPVTCGVSAQFIRQFASKRGPKNSMEEKVISDRLVLHQALSRSEWKWPVDPKRVLVLFFPWLGAKEKHIDKYRELYTSLGVDVLTVNAVPTDFLWPPNSFKLAKHVLKALDDRLDGYEHYLCHSMSIGCYNLTVLCMLARKQAGYKYVMDKFRGVIFDSLVVGAGKGGVIKEIESTGDHQTPGKAKEPVHAVDRMIRGVAESVSKHTYVQILVTYTAKLYFAATKKHTVDFYEKALDVVREKPVKVPTLVFTCKDDPVSDAAVVQKLVDIWKSDSKLPVTLVLWDSSAHAQHFVHHPEEYLAAQRKFISRVFPHDTPEPHKKQQSKL